MEEWKGGRCEAWSLGFGVWGSEFGVWSLGFGVYLNTLRETETSLGGFPGSYETWSRQFAW